MADRYVSSLAAGGGSGTSGSPWTLAEAMSNAGQSDRVFIKADGTYTVSTALTPTPNFVPTSGANWTQWIGYTSTIADNGRATLQLSGSATTIWSGSAKSGHWLRNLDLDCNSIASSVAADFNQYCRIENCIARNFKTKGIRVSANCVIHRCRVTGGASGATCAVEIASGPSTIQHSEIVSNVCTGISAASGAIVRENVIADNSGASSDGLNGGANFSMVIEHNVFDGNGRDGIRLSTNLMGFSVRGNLLIRNAGYGLNLSTGSTIDSGFTPNVYGTGSMANTSGACSVTLSSGDITTVSAEPFVNKAGGNFGLNSTANAGAVVRGAMAYTFPTQSQVSYRDGGAAQHADPTGGGISAARQFNGV